MLERSTDLALDVSDRPDAPLGTLLFRAGLVPEDELRDALEASIEQGRRLGEVLLERGLIGEHDLARILAGQKGLPFVDLHEREIDAVAVPLLSEEQARLWGALAIGFEEGVPVVVVSDPANRQVFGQITEALGRKPRFAAAPVSELVDAIAAAYARIPCTSDPRPGPAPAETATAADAPTARAETEPTILVRILLSNGERIEVSSSPDAAAALVQAKSLIRSLDRREPGDWPFAGGRFLRPDAIVSVDVVELSPAAR